MKHKLLLFLIVLTVTGCSLDELRHEISPSSGRASSSGAEKYTLTELRPNDGNNSGTISQPAKRIFRFFNIIRL